MTSLFEQQRLMLQYILNEDSSPSQLIDLIRPGGDLMREEALQVYRQDYRARMTNTLGKNYESIKAVLGVSTFAQLCSDFIDSKPCYARNLMQYGADFPEFLLHHSLSRRFPFLMDLASFERYFWQAFHAESVMEGFGSLVFADEGALANVHFTFRHPIFLICSEYRVHDLWLKRKEESSVGEDHWNTPQNLVLFRRGHEVAIRELSRGQASVLSDLLVGKPVGMAIESFGGTEEEMAYLFGLLQAEHLIAAMS